MQNYELDFVKYSVSLRPEPVGIILYVVDEAIRGVVPPTEWTHPEHKDWFNGFVHRLHRRFVRLLTQEQRDTIADLADRPIEELYSFHLDPQVAFRPERYRPDPERNAATYLRRAYGVGELRDICTEVKEQVLSDPSESICYSVANALRYLEGIW